MGMNLPTGFGGGGSGFDSTLGNIGGGVAALLQGLMAGRQMRDQEQMQQQQLAGEKQRNALGLYQLIAQIGQADPDALKSPGLQAYLKQQTQGSIPLPTDAQGNIDVNAFRTPLSALTQGAGYEKFLSLPKGSQARAQILAGFGGTDEQKQQLLNLDQQLSPTEVDNAASNYRYYMAQIQAGADPRPLVPVLNSLAQRSGDPQLQITPDGKVVPVGSDTALGASATTTAKIANLQSTTDKNNTTVAWMNKLNPARLANIEASTGLKREQIAYLPQRLAIMADNAATAAGRLKVAQDNLSMAQATFKRLGMTAQGVQAYNGVIKALGENVNQERQALSAVQANIARLKTAGIPSDTSTPQNAATVQLYNNMLLQEQHLQAKLGTDQQTLKTLNDKQATYAQSLQQHIIQKGGAPPNWKVAPTSGTTPGATTASPKGSAPPRATKPINGLPLTAYKGQTPYYLHADGKYYDAANAPYPGQ